MKKIVDFYNRPLEELRLSVIDKCNYRCFYCMPDNQKYNFLKKKDLLTKKEIDFLISSLVSLGLKSVRITGGEPLLRWDIVDIVALCQKYNLKDLSLTTNGELLGNYAKKLYNAGLKRINISLDCLDEQGFLYASGYRGKLKKVLLGIAEAKKTGLLIKINCLAKNNFTENHTLSLVKWAIEQNLELRFIEYMDVGNSNNWANEDVLQAKDIRKIIETQYTLKKEVKKKKSQTAKTYLINSKNRIGFVSSITEPFCQNCNRARVSAKGELFLCLFAQEKGYDLRPYLRAYDQESLLNYIQSIWQKRKDRYSQQRYTSSNHKKVEMYHIGG